MSNKKNKPNQNYPIVIGTLVVVILFLFLALNEFKVPTLGRKKTSDNISSGSSKGSGTIIESPNPNDSEATEFDVSDSGEDGEVKNDDLSSDEKKQLLSEYNHLLKMAERDNRKLKVSFVRYLDAYEARKGTAEEFFQEWKEKYEKEKDSVSREKNEVELEREKKAKERAEELIRESENMTLQGCQDIGDKLGLKLEEVLTLREGQIKIMKHALATGRTYEYSLLNYLEAYKQKKDIGLNARDFNRAHFERIGIR